MSVFLLKGLVFVKHHGDRADHEVTRRQQPRLFAFLDRLAEEVGAPRPKRVFLSPRVNASVFYDLSVLNLILPTRKNLEIGLGLVNVLTLGEFKAVCAHEFGHFAQHTMAVGRWVYVARQIASEIISKRDAFDDLLAWVSRLDLRVAWIGWDLRLIVWSIRSLLESAFRLVVLAERALAREMEMQADLVAVSLTGSDALIHALHKLARSSTSNRQGASGRGVALVSRQAAKAQRTPKRHRSYDENYKHCGSVRRFTSSRRLAISARREKSRFKRLGQNGREHCLRGFCAGTGWTRSAVIASGRDSRFMPIGICCLFSKLDTFVQILVLRDV